MHFWTPVPSRSGADFVVAPDERLSWPRTIGLGAQHVVAMFGATFLVPVLTGFPPATTLLFSGVGTVLFLLITGNRLPSYLGSSFSVIAPVVAAVASDGAGSALGGIVAVGLVLILVGGVVHLAGTRWLDLTLPPVVTGAIVALIGFNLAPVAKDNFEDGPLLGFVTLVLLVGALAFFRGMIGRLAIFLAVASTYGLALLLGEVDTTAIADAKWFGLPEFATPTFTFSVLPMFLPAVIALIAENIGHVKSVGQMTRTDMDPLLGRALAADGVATTLAGFGGGSATTTYAENIGVMAATRVYSTAAYWVAAAVAIALSLCPKVGAVIEAVPAGVLGGATLVLYGLVGILGVRIWLTNRVDFAKPVNQMTAAIPLIIGIADFTWQAGGLTFTGIALGSIAALAIYHGMRLLGYRA
ncbi:uracil-xanthine permease family protein [Mycolicibacterium duvalii]|uniref:Pyrimidine permease RutG n=1 Tax=Mycolicibacterium duvalii TaxID=39688 RepID=A0A7I7K644_9MYCO|nr:solute carrier family 23 protein [Mycolicibacterium duvalii]MCV7369119.1 nitrate reductase [Mycolicibacterium duvalii]BBX18979.1 pyrimidine permease RutG [Mycolicibacterium duvalii]